jgi:ParB-like chromosome segregation protein Spo0J
VLSTLIIEERCEMPEETSESKKVALGKILSNDSLDAAADEPKATMLSELLSRWGNFSQILVWEKDGVLVNLDGQIMLKALKISGKKSINIIEVPIKSEEEASLFVLQLNRITKECNNLSYSLLIKKLIGLGVSRKVIYQTLEVSKSWLSNKESLANNLDSRVIDLVKKNALHARTAEPIARLPKDVQLRFSDQVIANKLNKNQVEKLVSCYTNNNTPQATKDEIINDPSLSLNLINRFPLKKQRISKKKKNSITLLNTIMYTVKHIDQCTEQLKILSKDDIIINENNLRDLFSKCNDLCVKINLILQ